MKSRLPGGKALIIDFLLPGMNNTTKYIIWLVVLVVVVWGGYALLNKPKITSDESVKIGAVLGLTGPASTWSEYAKKAADLAVK